MAETGDRIGAYEIVRLIARGGMATVFEAQQPALDRRVALKRLDLRVDDPSMMHRFNQESRLAASFDHPNIVTVYDFFECDGVPYIAMEYLPRGSLRPCVGQLTPTQVFGVLEGMLAALAHAEEHGVAHRDLKPENVLITRGGSVKIADFGIAKAYTRATSAFTATGVAVGTPTYMAPEQALANPVGPYTDLYALGVMAYEMLSGGPPFAGGESPMSVMYKHVSEPPPRLTNLDSRLADWVAALLEKAPEDRPPGAAAAWGALEEIVVDTLGPYWRRNATLGELPAPPAGDYVTVAGATAPPETPAPTPEPVAPPESAETPAPVAPPETDDSSATPEPPDDGYVTVIGRAPPPGEPVAPDEAVAPDEPVTPDEPAAPIVPPEPVETPAPAAPPEPEPVVVATAAPRIATPAPVDDGRKEGQSPLRWVAAGVVGIVVAGVAAVLLLGGGGSSGGGGNEPHAAAPYELDGSKASLVAGLPAAGKVVIGGVDTPISGNQTEFGTAIASGDFDGDGKADLAIGGSDSVTVRYGPGESRSATFKTAGVGLAAGDMDADGYADLAAGGRTVKLLFGGPDGLTEEGSRTLQPPDGAAEGFGSALALGATTNDKRLDLAEAGQDHSTFCPGGAHGPTACETLGDGASALAIGDVTGDGLGDIVQGVPGAGKPAESDSGGPRGPAGVLRIWPGGGGSPSARPLTVSQATTGVRGDNQAQDEFGAALAVADLDGDGKADIVVGSPGESAPGKDDQTGRLTVVRGGPKGHGTTDDEGFGERTKGLPFKLPDEARLGSALTLLDVDGDGTLDLIAAAPGAGKVITLPGADGGFTVEGSSALDVPAENGAVSLGAP